MSRQFSTEGTGLYRVQGVHRDGTQSEPVGLRAGKGFSPNVSSTADDFDNPQKLYILETVARDARSKASRRLVVAFALVGIFVSQWPVAFSVANAVPSLPVSAHAAGVRAPVIVAPERLAFAVGMQREL